MNIAEAMRSVMTEYRKRYGAEACMEDGETFVTVFRNGVLIISKKNEEICVNMTSEKPFMLDGSIDVFEEEENA